MQNFMGIGPVVFAGEYVSMKIGCASYNTSKPVDSDVHVQVDQIVTVRN